MNLLKRFGYWLIKNHKESIGEDISEKQARARFVGNPIRAAGINDGNNGMNFTVYPATGGKVIQFVTYDPTKDRSYSHLYVVTDKDDLGDELAQIITKEALMR